MTFDDQRRFTDSQHALDGLDEGGLCVVHIGQRRSRRFAQNFDKNLPCGIFSESYRREQILDFRQTVVRRGFLEVGLIDLFQAAAERARFFFEQAATHVRGFFALVQIDPMADFTFGVRRLHEAEPIAARAMPLLRKYFNHIAA